MRQRTVLGLGFALLLAVAAIVAKPSPQWHPWCANLTDADPMWYVLMCFVDPPPNDPHA